MCCAPVNLFVMIECILDLLYIDRLVVLVQQLYLVLSQKQNDLVFNMLLLQSFEDQISFMSSELIPDPISNLASDFLHYLHVRALSHFG